MIVSEDNSGSYPLEFLEGMQALLGDEYPAFAESLHRDRSYGLRINPLKIDSADIGRILADIGADPEDSVPWCNEGYYYNKDSCHAGRSPYHEAGAYYIQEPSAMSVIQALDPQPGERICDLCAAPGGKTTHIAGRMMGKGILVANEIVPDRARILARNVERMGVTNCVVTNAAPDELSIRFPGYFHRVCVDAPCSGEGMFRKDEDAAGEWSTDVVDMCASRQKDILNAAAAMVVPGGVIVYSTCTFEPAENERVISNFLSEHPDWHIDDTGLDMIPSRGREEWADGFTGVALTTRIWPHISRGEGHYIARLVKDGEMIQPEEDETVSAAENRVNTGNNKPKRCNVDFKGSNVSLCEEVSRFLHTELFSKEQNIPLDRIREFGEHIYMIPGASVMKRLNGVKVIRPGLELAEKKKDRFEPAHALAVSTKTGNSYNTCNLTIDESLRFILGETFTPNAFPDHIAGKGWTLVSVNGVSLGWGKMTGNVLKNHYPKGLRRDLRR